jgi:hypothetical protein
MLQPVERLAAIGDDAARRERPHMVRSVRPALAILMEGTPPVKAALAGCRDREKRAR